MAVARWVSGEHKTDYAETFTAFRKRVMAALQCLIESADTSKDIWVFTSRGPIAAVAQGLLAIPDVRIFELNWTLVNTGVTKLLYRPDLHAFERGDTIETLNSAYELGFE